MSDVVFREIECSENKKIGMVELNNPKALNALTLNMISFIHRQLNAWESNEAIVCIVLTSVEPKAFCAGGDVVSLYKSIKSDLDEGNTLDDKAISNHACYQFFKAEYDLDLYIHQYPKPIIAWGDGYVFGGGLGLFAGASHRITTEKTILSMPETAIGLYPDVGASWFLNQMPNNLGVFLGITGAFFNSLDAKFLGLSDYSILSKDKVKLLKHLSEVNWQNKSENTLQIDKVLKDFEINSTSEMPVSNVKLNEGLISSLIASNNINDIYNVILSEPIKNSWLKAAQDKLKHASPLSVYLTYKQLERSKDYSKKECFDSELNLSLRCCQFSEFAEGVRAQLVDKDKSPKWKFESINDIQNKLASWFLASFIKT